jgi:hypothetical protein
VSLLDQHGQPFKLSASDLAIKEVISKINMVIVDNVSKAIGVESTIDFFQLRNPGRLDEIVKFLELRKSGYIEYGTITFRRTNATIRPSHNLSYVK